MNNRIYLSAPDIGPLEQEAVNRAISSGWVAPLGPEVDAFEAEIATRVGVKYGVAMNSGTAALHLALLAAGVGPGDTVITSTMTFVATANAILYTGAVPFFVDSDVNTGNINPELLRESILNLRQDNKKISAIVPVDLLGKAVQYDAISQIAQEFSIPLIADAAESLGAIYQGKAAGSWGNASIVSFNGNKIMTTSGGGMLLTDDANIASKARYLSTQARLPVLHYEHNDMGFNYRLSNVLAAIGRAQLSRLDLMIASRRAIREQYRSLFSGIAGVEIFDGGNDQNDNCWLTSVIIDKKIAGFSSDELSSYLNELNIENRPLWKPMHLQPLFTSSPAKIDGSSEYLFRHGLTLPSGSGMSPETMEFILANINIFLNRQK